MLVVQATGWGKSAVYWAATAVLRANGARTHADRLAAAGLMRDSARPRRALVAGGAVGPYIFSILVGETTRYSFGANKPRRGPPQGKGMDSRSRAAHGGFSCILKQPSGLDAVTAT